MIAIPVEWFKVAGEDVDVGHGQDEDQQTEDLEAGLGADLPAGGGGLLHVGAAVSGHSGSSHSNSCFISAVTRTNI